MLRKTILFLFLYLLPFQNCYGRIQYSSLNNGLVAFYNLEEASGTRADAGPYALNLTDNNSTLNQSSVNTQMGKAAAFVRTSNQYLSVSSSKLSFSSAVTFVAWVNMASKPAGNTMGIAGKLTSTNAINLEYGFQYTQASDRFFFRTRVNSASVIATANTFGIPSTGTWYFLVGIFDGSISSGTNVVKMSVNNSAFDTANSTATPILNHTSAIPFLIGSESNNTGAEVSSFAFDGATDGIGVWNRVLTAQEINELYQLGHGAQVPNL